VLVSAKAQSVNYEKLAFGCRLFFVAEQETNDKTNKARVACDN